MERCRREVAAVEAELLAGNPGVEGLRSLHNEQRRRAGARRRDGNGSGEDQASTE
jgi:hypothetical protein